MVMTSRAGALNVYDAYLFVILMLVASGLIVSAATVPRNQTRDVRDAERTLSALLRATVPHCTYRVEGRSFTVDNWTVASLLVLYSDHHGVSKPGTDVSSIRTCVKDTLDGLCRPGRAYRFMLVSNGVGIIVLESVHPQAGASVSCSESSLSNKCLARLELEI